MISYKDIKNKKGVALPILMALFPIANWIGVILLFGRAFGKQKLRNVPAFVINDKYHLGSAFIYGTINTLLGIILFLPFFFNDQSKDDLWIYPLLAVPCFFLGFLLLLHASEYLVYKKKLELFLDEFNSHPHKKLNELVIIYNMKVYNYADIEDWVADLNENELLPYRDIPYVEPQKSAVVITVTWDCKSCGAHNSISVVSGGKPVCEYCGSPKTYSFSKVK